MELFSERCYRENTSERGDGGGDGSEALQVTEWGQPRMRATQWMVPLFRREIKYSKMFSQQRVLLAQGERDVVKSFWKLSFGDSYFDLVKIWGKKKNPISFIQGLYKEDDYSLKCSVVLNVIGGYSIGRGCTWLSSVPRTFVRGRDCLAWVTCLITVVIFRVYDENSTQA